MTTATVPPAQSAPTATESYERQIRPQVDTEQNRGRFVAFDPQTAQFEIAETGVEAARLLRQRFPRADVVVVRIGYDLAVDSFGRPRYLRR